MFKKERCVTAFTIAELLVVMAIISIVLGLAIPRFHRASMGTKLKTTADSLVGLLETAKSYAQAQHTSCAVVYDSTKSKLSLQKKDIDDADNDLDRDELIEFDRGITVPSGIVVYFTADSHVTFSPFGSVENADDDITLTAGSINKVKTIVVNANTGYIQSS